MKTIIYYCPNFVAPIGGVRVLYSHSQVINDLADERINSQIHHWWDPGFVCTWFEHSANRKMDKELNPDRDFVMFAESQIYTMWKDMVAQGVRYGIFAQNGYVLNANIAADEIAECYEKASLIVSISDDVTQCIEFLFPQHMHKLIQVHYTVDPALFNVDEGLSKRKVITYMPRKNAGHVALVMNYLKMRLSPEWVLQPIEGLNQEGVAKALQESSIFMAFSEFEGVPLPPVEAALCGNLVVGNHGEGGREYWSPPIFTDISMGNIKQFAGSVLEQVQLIESVGMPAILEQTAPARKALAKRYSRESELLVMRNLAERVLKTFDPA